MMNRARRQMFREKLFSFEKMVVKKKVLSASKLQDIAQFALTNIQMAKVLTESVTSFIEDCDLEAVSAGFYVVDCICRKSSDVAEKPRYEYARSSYVLEFAEALPEVCNATWERVHKRKDIQDKILKLFVLWYESKVFSKTTILRFIKSYKGDCEALQSLPKSKGSSFVPSSSTATSKEEQEDTTKDSREKEKEAREVPESLVKLGRSNSGFFDQLRRNTINFSALAEQENSTLTPRGEGEKAKVSSSYRGRSVTDARASAFRPTYNTNHS
ncbi:SR-related and CTD-associated factor 8 [Balamuthia mandrillaris]